jgi:hypothetical protein
MFLSVHTEVIMNQWSTRLCDTKGNSDLQATEELLENNVPINFIKREQWILETLNNYLVNKYVKYHCA